MKNVLLKHREELRRASWGGDVSVGAHEHLSPYLLPGKHMHKRAVANLISLCHEKILEITFEFILVIY